MPAAFSIAPPDASLKRFTRATCGPDDGSDAGPWIPAIVTIPDLPRTPAELRRALAAAERRQAIGTPTP